MSTGDDTIDRQHQELITHLNILFDMMQRGEGGKVVKDVQTQNELSAWLTQHIIYTDTQLRSCVRKTA